MKETYDDLSLEEKAAITQIAIYTNGLYPYLQLLTGKITLANWKKQITIEHEKNKIENSKAMKIHLKQMKMLYAYKSK